MNATAHAKARYIEATSTCDGQRLDNFLAARFRDVPKSHLYRLLRTGQVRVNGGRCKPGYRLAPGDRVRLPPIERVRIASVQSVDHGQAGRAVGSGDMRPAGRHAHNTAPILPVLYEDDDLLVIDKPAGLAVHSGSGIRSGVIEILRAQGQGGAEGFLELAHRLDRDTSGCLLLARSRPALLALHQQWQQAATMVEAGGDRGADNKVALAAARHNQRATGNGTENAHTPQASAQAMQKRYTALVCGDWQGGARRVDAALQRERRGGERLSIVAELTSPAIKNAVSLMTPQRRFRNYTLMQVELLTGRTHQARVHAASLGHPLAGDTKYGARAYNRALRDLGLRRLFLHASSLRFRHPQSGAVQLVQSPLPPELASLLTVLQPPNPTP